MSLQMRIPRSGTEIESPSGKSVWMDPGRDIAHAFTTYCAKVDDVMELQDSNAMSWYYANAGTDEDRAAFFKFLAEFIRQTGNFEEAHNLATALTNAGYLQLPLNVRLAGGHAFLNVLLGAFFKGAREASLGSGSILADSLFVKDKYVPTRGLKGRLRGWLLRLASTLR